MTEKQSFILQKLNLRKSPGLLRGLKSINDLSPNINLVYGSNSSGKSSLAQAIQQLIWQENRRGVELDASAIVDDDSWIFHIDNQPILTQKNGVDAYIPDVPPLEMRKHYTLSIADLFIDDDVDLAREIRKQASGGFDLDSARKALKYSPNIYPSTIKEYKEFEAARYEVKTIKNKQRLFKEEESSLEGLRIEELEAKQARAKVDFLEKVISYLEKSVEVSQLETDFNQYPEIYELLRGDELDRIDELENAIKKDRAQVNLMEQKIKHQQELLALLNIPSEGIPREVLDELEQRLEQLQSLEGKLIELQRNIAEIERTRNEWLIAVDQSIDPEIWQGINIESTAELDKILMEAHDVLATRYLITNRLQQLEEEFQGTEKPEVALDQLRKGLLALSEWLKVESIDRKYGTWSILLLGFSMIASGIVIYRHIDLGQYFPWLLMGVPVVVIVLYFYMNNSSKNEQLKIREKDFESTGLEKPEELTSKQVVQYIEKIISGIQYAESRLKNDNLKVELESALEKNNNSIAELQKRTQRFREAYRTVPGLPDYNEENYTTHFWFIKNVEKWQNANTKYKASKDSFEQVSIQFTAELTRINDLLQRKCNADTVKDFTRAKAVSRKIKEDMNTREQSLARINIEQDKLEQSKIRIKANTEKLNRIYQDIGLTEQNKSKLSNYLNDLGNYKNLKVQYDQARSVLNERHSHVRAHSLEGSNQYEIDSLHIDQLESELEGLRIIAKNHESIRDNITRIETEIGAKKRENTLEKALNTVDAAKIALEQKYSENLNLIAGDIIIRNLQSIDRTSNQPQVVLRANVILGKITSYRYELLSGHEGNETFIVKDMETDIGQSLDQLSSGTRVQLLLAVKIAYLELQENSLKLPILADELLANSDDIRAPDIIRTFIELSNEDRQIFYFTAQRDEKRLWEEYLEKEGIGYRSYTLGEVNEDARRNTVVDVRDVPLSIAKAPNPDGLDYVAYGKLISNDFDLIEDRAEQLPLYFLMDDVFELYGFLNKGITRWIHLKKYLQYDGKLNGIRTEQLNEMKEKISVLEKYQMLNSIGRSRRIDRSVLEDSGAISDIHMESAIHLLNEVDGQPDLLIKQLEDGGVSRFRSNKIAELREYCIAQNLLDPSDKLTDDEIPIRLQALLSHMKLSGGEAEKFLKRIIDHQHALTLNS